jgi:multidrug transporter EmrE-like cation transporter
MNIKILFFILVVIATVFEVIADVLLKKWAIGNRLYFLLIGLGIYFIGTIFWAVSLKYELLSKSITIFTILNLIILVLVGVLIFNEDLSLINKIGIGIGILSVILIEI